MNNQIVGNTGLYLTCYELSRRGWNVMPTARNAKGVDIVIYNSDATRYLGVQVKSLSKRNPVPLGNSLDKIMGDFWVIVNNLASITPKFYILKPEEVKKLAHPSGKGEHVSYWLEPPRYTAPKFHNQWERIK